VAARRRTAAMAALVSASVGVLDGEKSSTQPAFPSKSREMTDKGRTGEPGWRKIHPTGWSVVDRPCVSQVFSLARVVSNVVTQKHSSGYLYAERRDKRANVKTVPAHRLERVKGGLLLHFNRRDPSSSSSPIALFVAAARSRVLMLLVLDGLSPPPPSLTGTTSNEKTPAAVPVTPSNQNHGKVGGGGRAPHSLTCDKITQQSRSGFAPIAVYSTLARHPCRGDHARDVVQVGFSRSRSRW
jgi:hypothetical protein